MTIETLTAEEWELVKQLRDVPDGVARHELVGLLNDLLVFVRDPRCPESQGDGVPCRSVDVACDDCRSVANVLALLHSRLHAAA